MAMWSFPLYPLIHRVVDKMSLQTSYYRFLPCGDKNSITFSIYHTPRPCRTFSCAMVAKVENKSLLDVSVNVVAAAL